MRLLYRNDEGEYSLAEFFGYTPPYAALSHTWSGFIEEVTLRDIMEHKAVHKQGYQKILFCGVQAAKDGFRYFWIDTCCIDNMSSVEVLEAVNSMSRWYENAAQCYVYPDAISTNNSNINISLQRSKWFSLAWILQELIDPTSIEFVSREDVSVGTKMTKLHRATEVPIQALSGAPVSGISIEKQLSWKKGHKLRREEDESYALLRIFGENMQVVHGEGKENAYRRLWMKILKINNAISYPGWTSGSGEGPYRTTIPGQIRAVSLTEFGVPAIPEPDSDDESETTSVFSDGGMSSSTTSTAGLHPVQTMGIREVSQALLSNDDLRAMYIAAVNSIERRKVRSLFRGFLKNYGRYLLKDTFGNTLEVQAAKFVIELAGHIADEITWAVTGPEEPTRSLRTRLERKDLETWLSNSQIGGSMGVNEPELVNWRDRVEEIFDEDEPDENFDRGLSFPNIDRVKSFLLHSAAFQTHVEEMRTWLKMGGSKRKDAGQLTGKDDEHLIVEDVTEETLDIPTIPEEPRHQMDESGEREVKDAVKVDTEHLNIEDVTEEMLDSPTFTKELQQQEDKDGKRKAEDLTKVDTGHLDIPSSPREPPVDAITTDICQQQADQEDDPSVETDKGPQQESTQHESTQEARPRPRPQPRPHPPPPHQAPSVRDLISALFEFWGLSFFVHDIVDLFLPSVPTGYRRLSWRCSCNTILWGDFPAGDEDAFEQLKREVLGTRGAAHQTPSSGSSTQQGTGASASGSAPAQTTNATNSSTGPNSTPSTNTSPSSPSNATSAAPSGTDHVVNIAVSVGYFEVCVSKGNHAIDHHEIDISRITSDSELFELIWDKYNVSRGRGLRRVFLRPRDVNFVMFSISRRTHYGAGIHRKPDEFPPQAELDTKRYHYLCPQIRMPGNVFLHYLHRARWNIWGEHSETTWLQRLPKKLNRSLVIEALQNAQHDDNGAPLDADLAFGWGVHILEGPNHAALGWLFAGGVAVSFVVSALLVGFAKTQEQGFGVGSYIVGVVGLGMAAVYSQLQDQ